MVDAKRLVELEGENHELRNSLNTARLKVQLAERAQRQYVVLELSDGQVPKAGYGPFDGLNIASAFAVAVRAISGRADAATTVLELNKEPLE